MSAANYNRQEIYVPLERTRFIRRRNKYDILAEILAACKKQPRTQSWLLTHLRLSTSSAKEYIGFLLASRLLDANETEQHRTTTYTTTATGKEALENYTTLTAYYFSI
jgi:predicted transcriptional regulator